MAIKKSLYQLLEVSADAGSEVLQAAFEARSARLANAVSAEDLSARAILRDAYEILSDPLRRRQYDERLREERIRALSSGMEEARPRPANARLDAGPSDSPAWYATSQLLYGMSALIIATVVGAWVYFDHTRKVAALRIESERISAERKLRELEAQRQEERAQRAAERTDTQRESTEERQRQAEIERARRQYIYEQQTQSQRAASEERRKQAEQRTADYRRQRDEQESLRRSQMQLERDRRYLHELERNRGQKF